MCNRVHFDSSMWREAEAAEPSKRAGSWPSLSSFPLPSPPQRSPSSKSMSLLRQGDVSRHLAGPCSLPAAQWGQLSRKQQQGLLSVFPQRSTSGLLLLGFLLLLTNSQQELQPQPLKNTLPAELHNKQGTAGTGPFVRR